VSLEIFRKWDEGSMDWFDLTQGRDTWALVTAVINLLVA